MRDSCTFGASSSGVSMVGDAAELEGAESVFGDGGGGGGGRHVFGGRTRGDEFGDGRGGGGDVGGGGGGRVSTGGGGGGGGAVALSTERGMFDMIRSCPPLSDGFGFLITLSGNDQT